jgi:hypothetical protein
MPGSGNSAKKWPADWKKPSSKTEASRPEDAERLKKEAAELHLKIQDLVGKDPKKAAKVLELWLNGNPPPSSSAPRRTSKK